ncbi:Antitoxin component of toxin-antitoxin stability system, DNA-binding transcriptional repressor [Agrococcus baldri]|uniref:Antitoxin component of toxin-antitoxin stability system, DNA-binding transcriptional repressor n=2 Tax=Agrococcus baldri TaxID=153730 RepID=A0AA94HPP0_9MICO|nr:Antitoxin component of toxin-antitoxin stability system, DNA-binding transcriptional repressor [Agrococcus baldri]
MESGYIMVMESATIKPARVGIRALRDGLSAQLQRVKAGETIEVTEHGRVIARIVPATQESKLERLIAAGLVTLPTGQRRALPEPLVVDGTVSDLIADQRR